VSFRATEEELARAQVLDINGTLGHIFDGIEPFDIRNGDPSSVKPIMVKATLAQEYRWPVITGMPHTEAVKNYDLFVRAHMYQLARHGPTGEDEATRRKKAIVLGVSRAVMTTYYRLGEADLIPGEVGERVANVEVGAQGALRVSALVAPDDANRAVLSEALALNEVERNVVSTLLQSAIGALPVQGYSLMMTGHHYLSEGANQSKKAFDVIEKQFWKHSTVREWFQGSIDNVRDWAWHKAGHPVHITLKHKLATDPSTAEMLKACQCGSAASRLPAVEAVLRAAGSYVTLFSTVEPLFQIMGGSINYRLFAAALEIVKGWVPGIDLAEGDVPSWWPRRALTRVKAVEYISSLLDRNAATAAYCYGFYSALSENSQVMGAGDDTLKSSYSLMKLKKQSLAAFVDGTQAYGDYRAVRVRRQQEGVFKAPEFVLKM
jgi:hypothetical protein